MSSNPFTWCDLSTFNLEKAHSFYSNVLNWEGHDTGGFGEIDDYTLFYAGSYAAAGIYTMPPFFVKIGMPSFWMSYVRVEGLQDCVERAQALGAKCEIEPTLFDENSHFALIRDPSGAGFTLYEGPDLAGHDAMGRHGRMMWNELHVPSLDLVASFYQELFGWRIARDPSYRHTIELASGEAIASIMELDESIKGPKNYWAVVFATSDLEASLNAIHEHGGSIIMRPGMGLDFAMATDDQGAMLCLAEPA